MGLCVGGVPPPPTAPAQWPGPADPSALAGRPATQSLLIRQCRAEAIESGARGSVRRPAALSGSLRSVALSPLPVGRPGKPSGLRGRADARPRPIKVKRFGGVWY